MAVFGLKELEARIGHKPGTDTFDNHSVYNALMETLMSGSSKSVALKQDLLVWLEKNGIPPTAMKRMQPPTLAKCYAITAYLRKVRSEHNPQWDLLGDDDDEAALAQDATQAQGKSNGSAGGASAMDREALEALFAEFDARSKKTIDERFANISISSKTRGEIEDLARTTAFSVAERLLAERLPPREIIVKRAEGGEAKNIGQQHFMFDKLLKLAQSRNHQGFSPNIWLSGVTGGGKTTAVQNLAEALGVEFEAEGGLEAAYQILGHINPGNGQYTETAFFRRFTCGGILLLDEIDTYSPRALLAFNSGAANNFCQFPHGLFKRHPDFILVAAGNTWGLGATNDYTGRTKIDRATLDRFGAKLNWVIDEKLERYIATQMHPTFGPQWHDLMLKARAAQKRHGLQIIISPRATYNGVGYLRDGFPIDEVLEMTIHAGLSDQQITQLGVRGATLDSDEAIAAFSPDRIRQLVREGRKIEAIRLHREHYGSGLAEAKDAIEIGEFAA